MNINKYVGLSYNREKYDCADFAIQVQRELFGREVSLPAARPRIHTGGQRHLQSISQQYAERTDSPRDGDLVLMAQLGRKHATHIGVYFWRDHAAWVLHCTEAVGYSVCQRVSDLGDACLQVEGYYRLDKLQEG